MEDAGTGPEISVSMWISTLALEELAPSANKYKERYQVRRSAGALQIWTFHKLLPTIYPWETKRLEHSQRQRSEPLCSEVAVGHSFRGGHSTAQWRPARVQVQESQRFWMDLFITLTLSLVDSKKLKKSEFHLPLKALGLWAAIPLWMTDPFSEVSWDHGKIQL